MKQQLQSLLSALSLSSSTPGSPSKLQALLGLLSNSANMDQNANPNTDQQNSDANTVMGGEGNDTISGGDASGDVTPKSQSLNDILNAAASGKGGIDYSGLQNSYPIPAAPIAPPPNQDIYNYMMSSGKDGESAGMTAGKAMAYANAQNLARQQAQNSAMNARDVDAFKAAIGLSKESGNTQSEKRNAEALAAYRNSELDISQQKADAEHNILVPMADGSYGVIDRKNMAAGITPLPGSKVKTAGGASTDKPLSADIQRQLGNSFDQFLGVRDAKGNMLEAEKDIDPTQKNKILASAAMYLQQNPKVGVQGAIGHVINDQLGGVNSITDDSGMFSKTHRVFPEDKMATIAQQRDALSNAAQKIGGGGEESIPTGGSVMPSAGSTLTPAQMEVSVKTAIRQGATPDQIKKIAQQWGVDIDPRTGTVTPKGWQ